MSQRTNQQLKARTARAQMSAWVERIVKRRQSSLAILTSVLALLVATPPSPVFAAAALNYSKSSGPAPIVLDAAFSISQVAAGDVEPARMVVQQREGRMLAVSASTLQQLKQNLPVDLRVELSSHEVRSRFVQEIKSAGVDLQSSETRQWQARAYATGTQAAFQAFDLSIGIGRGDGAKTEEKGANGLQILKRQTHRPVMLMRVSNLDALDRLLSTPKVFSVLEPFRFEALTARSLPRIRQTAAYIASSSNLGVNTSVAVLELKGVPSGDSFGSCGANNFYLTGTPSSVDICRLWIPKLFDREPDDVYQPVGDAHALSVAAIVSAVAPKARVIALSVTGGVRQCNILTAYFYCQNYFEDALDWVIDNAGSQNIAALNMSIGWTDSFFDSPGVPLFNSALSQDFLTLRGMGVVPVAASGNDGRTGQMRYPAADPSTISVAATYSAPVAEFLGPETNTLWYPEAQCGDYNNMTPLSGDFIACFSNLANFTSLAAPGAEISAGGYTYAGTSQAAPHVAGSVAALKSLGPDLTSEDIIARLINRGPLVRRPQGNIELRRLDLLAAASNTLTVYSTLNGLASGGVSIAIDRPIRPRPESELPAGGGVLLTSVIPSDPSSFGWFLIGTQIVATAPATDSTGGTFAGWSGCDSTSLATRSCSVQLYGYKGITAAYTRASSPANYTISIAKTGQGTVLGQGNAINCGATCSTVVAADNTISLLATGVNGHALTNWSNCPAPTGNTCNVTATSNRTVTANFVPLYRLDVFKNNPGTVTSALGSINCGADCTSLYAPGTSITLTASPAASFVNWAGCPSAPNGNVCTFTIAANVAITANFAATTGVGQCVFSATPPPTILSVSAGGSLYGATLAGPVGCAISVTNSNPGACVTNSASTIPANGQTSLSIGINATGTARTCSIGVMGLSGTWTINQAAPATQTYNVNTNVYTNGLISGTGGFVTGCNGPTAVGTLCNMVATANPGYWFAGWADGGTILTSNTTYAFTLSGPLTLTASFQPVVGYGNYTVSIVGPPEGRMRPADGTGKWRRHGDVVRIQVGNQVGTQCSAAPNYTLVNIVPVNTTIANAGGGTLQCVYSQTTPYITPALNQASQPRISAGSSNSLARLTNGTVASWGMGNYGMNANGTGLIANDAVRPRIVDGISGAVGVHSHQHYAYVQRAVLADGTIKSWGNSGTALALGTGTTTTSFANTPQASIAFGGNVRKIVGGTELLTLKANGQVWWASINSVVASNDLLPSPVNVVDIASTGSASYVLDREGRVWNVYTNNDPPNPFYIGISSYSGTQSGFDVSGVYDERPVVLSGLTRIKAIAAAERAAFALREDGTVWVWGLGNPALLAGATYPRFAHPQNDPVPVPSLPPGITAISAGGEGEGFALAIDASGNVWSWGDNSSGQLGRVATTPSNSPAIVPGLSNVVEVSVGSTHAFAVQNDGSVWAWGNNGRGQLGDGTKVSRSSPVQVLCPSGFAGYLNLNSDNCIATSSNVLTISNYSANPPTALPIVTINGENINMPPTGSFQANYAADSTVTLDIYTPVNYRAIGWLGDIDTTTTFTSRITLPMNRDWDIMLAVAGCRYSTNNDTNQNNISPSGIASFTPSVRPLNSVPLQAYATCKWETVASAPWLRAFPRTGTGALSPTFLGTTFTVDPNTTTSQRTGTIQIGDAVNGIVTYNFHQLGADPDGIPDGFGFAPATNAAANFMAYSSTITPTGFNVPLPISVMGGELSVNSQPYTAATGVINPGDSVSVRTIASPAAGVTLTVNVTIGGLAASPPFLVTSKLPFCNLDIDNDALVLPDKDGLILLRALLGFSGDALTSGIVLSNPSTTSASVSAAVAANLDVLDIDGDGSRSFTRDGLLLIRWMQGLRGIALTNGVAFSASSVRDNAGAVDTFISGACFPIPP